MASLGSAIRVRLDDVQRAELDRLATLDNRRVSELVRFAITDYITRRTAMQKEQTRAFD